MDTQSMDRGDGPETIIANRYRVVRSLGRGGMGKVFLVDDQVSGERLAMKLLRNQWQYNEHVIERFAREVYALRKLNHPCIVKIFEARREDDLLFYTMEYIEGKSVREWLSERRRLGFGSTVRVLALVADGLAYAHEVTTHRDMSPDNVMVMRDGSVRILDFGLAKLNDAVAGLTMVGANMGKMQYNAPEQQQNAADVDHRADIYSLGVMFFEMLTGRRPKPGRIFHELRPDLPRSCEKFAAKAMAADREERFQSATEFRTALLGLYDEYEAKKTGKTARKRGKAGRGFRNPFRMALDWLRRRRRSRA